jgi:hypothetical protein
MFADLTVAGYPYNDVSWRVVAPAMVTPGPYGYNLRQHIFKDGVGQAVLTGLTAQVAPEVTYQVKLDLSVKAIKEAKRNLDRRDRKAAFGVTRLVRLHGENQAPGEMRVSLEGLDEPQLIDRLTGALLTWHAETFGQGPAKQIRRGPRQAPASLELLA